MTRHAVRRPRCGFTLVELVVVVAIMAVLAGVGGIAFVRLARADDAPPAGATLVRAARREALRRGVAVTIADSAPGRAPRRATAYPDGRVVADTALGIDALTGTFQEGA